MPARPLGEVKSLTYRIETTWPDTSKPEKANEFGSYYAHSYTDVRNPGNDFKTMLVNTQKELFDKRCTSKYGGTSESLHFDTLDDAINAAQFIEKWGRMGSGWDKSSQEKYQIQRRGPLKVRIIQEFNLTKRVEIEFESEPPADEFEIELAALKKKHGKE